jgi:transcription initiation factor TFIIIB Brf1 subunit/transcription initiation factor TFIIB
MNMRKPTADEMAKIEKSRERLQMGQAGERDLLSKYSTTSRKAAKDMQRQANEMRESVDPAAREYELAVDSGYKKGGKVKKMATGGSASKRADGCAVKGKTRGKMV